MKQFIALLLAIAIHTAVSSAANAAHMVNSTGLSSFDYRVTFDEISLPKDTVVTDQFAARGVTFSTTTIPDFSTSAFVFDRQGSVGGCLSNPGGGDSCFNGLNGHTIGSEGANPTFIHFDSVQHYAAFGMASNARQFVFTALLSGQPVESFSIYSSGGSEPIVDGDPAGYYGFTGISFDTIEILSVLNNIYDNGILLDNIQFETVPDYPILTIHKSGDGSGTVSANGISCGTDCSEPYINDIDVNLTATTDTNSTFSGWTGCDSVSSNTCTVSMAGDKLVTATFTLDTHMLTATTTGTGSGLLNASGLSCAGNTCTGTFNYNEIVHIIAVADTGSVFADWSGCDSVNGNICTVLINADRNISATFNLEYSLLVNFEGTGDGRVVSTPSGIDCQPMCSDTFPVGTPVVLKAYPYAGSAFAYWSGGCTGVAEVCTVTMTENTPVTAHFVSDETKEYKLSVGKKSINKGDGLIQSDDGTISCGDVCTELYYPNTPITLRSTPSPGSLFEGWSPTSSNCGTSPTCNFTMTKNTKIKAIFRGPYKLLAKIKSKNDGSGSVTSDISGIGNGINCPSSSCEDYYSYGNNVVLTAQPGGGSQFLGWKPSSIGCGANLSCSVPMIKKQTVTATFEGM